MKLNWNENKGIIYNSDILFLVLRQEGFHGVSWSWMMMWATECGSGNKPQIIDF